ncbi:zinc finger MYM-type protein 1-like [Medicago truncatula]|uniref:zinc finger MYM-type protein 1-like n=1 Tax=Medicago truncatula TaxID=3880 RepID=UPI001967FF7E|nr:zinc finger MYM-type protein 1-like [Medicago truncatula]
MALVLRFVDKAGLIQERFFDVARVNDIASLTLKEAVCGILSRHNLDVSNIRGQGYDGASNMRGEWNGLQALFIEDCPYAYYVHCFAHRLQLALVTASREVASIHKFFEKLTFVVNVVGSSTKRHDELQAAQEKKSKKFAQRADADSSYNHLKSFDFIFILHLMKEIMGTTDLLCQALQKQSQDVVNTMLLVRSTKALIQDLRENGWDKLFANVVSFCEKHDIEVPDLNDCPSTTRFGCSRLKDNQVIEHYFRVEIFFTTIDKQLQELNSRFSEQAMALLSLSCALSPEDGYKAFDINTICTLVEKYYPMDFSDQENINLPFHLQHFLFEARESSTLKNLSTIQELCSCLVAAIPANGQPKKHLLLDWLLRLVMTLPVSTATTERSFQQ